MSSVVLAFANDPESDVTAQMPTHSADKSRTVEAERTIPAVPAAVKGGTGLRLNEENLISIHGTEPLSTPPSSTVSTRNAACRLEPVSSGAAPPLSLSSAGLVSRKAQTHCPGGDQFASVRQHWRSTQAKACGETGVPAPQPSRHLPHCNAIWRPRGYRGDG
jgi:hypothetical protein